VKTLDAMLTRAATPQQQQEVVQLQQTVRILADQINNEISPRLAEALKRPNQAGRKELR
jgi:hypothetical protein